METKDMITETYYMDLCKYLRLKSLRYSGIPCVNSLGSILHFLERPIMHAELLQIQKKLGKKNFPLIEQTFYPSFREMNFHPEYPLVLKVGHVHAGYGKIKVENEDVFNDTTSILAINGNYSTAEPFYKGKYDLRIQCIGDHIRVYKREGYNWKTNTGPAILSDVEITSIYKIWVDEVKKIYKGFDIFAIDVIHTEDDEEYILEVNDSSIGLGPNHATEDLNYIKELVLKKMKESFQIKELVKIEKQDKEVELLNLKNNINEQRETIKQLIEEVEILKAEKIRYKKLIQQKSEEKSSGISFYYLYIPAFILIILLLIKFFS